MIITQGKQLETIPTDQCLLALLGETAFRAWQAVDAYIGRDDDGDVAWDIGRKAGRYEKKYRKSGKTLCALYAREKAFGFMVVLGGKEREAFEANRESFSETVTTAYDRARTYHDGKWLMIEVTDDRLLPDTETLLRIKRKPKGEKRKATEKD